MQILLQMLLGAPAPGAVAAAASAGSPAVTGGTVAGVVGTAGGTCASADKGDRSAAPSAPSDNLRSGMILMPIPPDVTRRGREKSDVFSHAIGIPRRSLESRRAGTKWACP